MLGFGFFVFSNGLLDQTPLLSLLLLLPTAEGENEGRAARQKHRVKARTNGFGLFKEGGREGGKQRRMMKLFSCPLLGDFLTAAAALPAIAMPLSLPLTLAEELLIMVCPAAVPRRPLSASSIPGGPAC